MTTSFFSVFWSSSRDPRWGTVLKQCSWPFWGLRLSWDVVFVDIAVCHLCTLAVQLQWERWTRLRVRAVVTRPCLEEHVNSIDFCQLSLLYMPWSSSNWDTHSHSNPPQPLPKPPPLPNQNQQKQTNKQQQKANPEYIIFQHWLKFRYWFHSILGLCPTQSLVYVQFIEQP